MATRRKGSTAGHVIGGMVVGFDQLIFRTTPPVHELVAKGQPLRAPSGDGDSIDVIFPPEPNAARTDPTERRDG